MDNTTEMAAVELVAAQAVVEPLTAPLPGVGRDLARSVGEATRALSYLSAAGEHDVAVNVITVLECTGSGPADALQAGADVLRAGDTLTLHGLQWTRVPDAAGQWSYGLLMLVSALDPELGEAGPVHHGGAESRVVLYFDGEGEAPALTALPRRGLTQAQALQEAADTVRQRPELVVEGLLWARVPARRADAWEYRLTVLASTAPGRGMGRPAYLDRAGR